MMSNNLIERQERIKMDKNVIDTVVAKLKELVAKGNVSRIVIRSKNGSEVLNIPVNAGVAGGVLMLAAAKWALIIGTLATVAAGCTVEVVKTNNEIVNVVKPGDGEKLRGAAVKIAGGVKDKVLDLAAEAAAKRNGAQDADVYEVVDETNDKANTEENK